MTHDGNYQPGGDGIVAVDELKSFFERIESVEASIKDFNEEKSEIYKEAKSKGYHVKAIKELIKERRADPAERSELEAVCDLYRKAVLQ